MSHRANKRSGGAFLGLVLCLAGVSGCTFARLQATSTDTGAYLVVSGGGGGGSELYHCVVQPGARPVCTPVVEQ